MGTSTGAGAFITQVRIIERTSSCYEEDICATSVQICRKVRVHSQSSHLSAWHGSPTVCLVHSLPLRCTGDVSLRLTCLCVAGIRVRPFHMSTTLQITRRFQGVALPAQPHFGSRLCELHDTVTWFCRSPLVINPSPELQLEPTDKVFPQFMSQIGSMYSCKSVRG